MKTVLTIIDPATYGINRGAAVLGLFLMVGLLIACQKILSVLSHCALVK